MLKIEKRYKYFCIGAFVASLTWVIIIYLYWKLTTENLPQSSLRTYSTNDVIIPYEDSPKHKQRSKSKYLQPGMNSIDIDRLKLKPIKIADFNEIGQVRYAEDLKFRNEGYKVHGFNALASKDLDYHRKIPDTRHKLCQSQNYTITMTASVVICFYNEQFDTLIRTLHSILDRTSGHILHEIILVDDFSDIKDLHETVKLYIEANLNKKVKLFKTEKREGLIRARIFGADLASGDALVFLDSHVEVNRNWLEPLLDRISENRTRVVTPIIDIINADTFEYSSSPLVRGGFTWGLHFKWVNLPIGTLNSDQDFIKPITSPTMAGGLFAIDRNYFIKLGKYDPGMNIWGGENIEISFRIWLCGGSIEIIPCSRVGHVFRKRRPYGAPDGEDTMLRNSLRAAHVWMDDYKEFFKQRPEAENVPYGDISSRLKLKKELNCKPFSWYLKNVYPDLALPDDPKEVAKAKANAVYRDSISKTNYIGQYQIRLSGTNLCISSEKDVKTKGSKIILRTCLRIKNQLWSETDKGELKLAQYLCLDAEKQIPTLGKCHQMGATQDWKHKKSFKTPIYNLAAGTCLAANKIRPSSYVGLDICSSNENSQWDFIFVPY